MIPICRVIQDIPVQVQYEKGAFLPNDGDPVFGSGWPLSADFGVLEQTMAPDGTGGCAVFIGPNADWCGHSYVFIRKGEDGLPDPVFAIGFASMADARGAVADQLSADSVMEIVEVTMPDLRDALEDYEALGAPPDTMLVELVKEEKHEADPSPTATAAEEIQPA